jgi:hypothetical protein
MVRPLDLLFGANKQNKEVSPSFHYGAYLIGVNQRNCWGHLFVSFQQQSQQTMGQTFFFTDFLYTPRCLNRQYELPHFY